MQVQQYIYLQDDIRHPVTVSQRRNGRQIELFHMKWFNGG